jgi:hypothetical protein
MHEDEGLDNIAREVTSQTYNNNNVELIFIFIFFLFFALVLFLSHLKRECIGNARIITTTHLTNKSKRNSHNNTAFCKVTPCARIGIYRRFCVPYFLRLLHRRRRQHVPLKRQ